MQEEIREINSCDDFELNIKRDKLLKYKLTYPSDREIQAIVFIIPGFGEDTNSNYMDNLREYVAETFSVAVVHVFYHCFYSRVSNGAILEFDELDLVVLQDVIDKNSIDFSDVQEITTENVVKRLIKENIDIVIPMTLVPSNGEYQNFGIMQAIDHLHVLQDLKSIESLKEVSTTVCIGSSHGGYIANLISKIAPNTIDYIVDNSSYVKPSLQYIVGKETNVNVPQYVMQENKLQANCFVQTYWTTAKSSQYYFSSDRYRIRDIGDKEHLKVMSQMKGKKTQYIFYHSQHDVLAPIEDKLVLVNNLKDYGFEVSLKIIEKEDDVDGKFIKSLEHGMGMSIKELINIELANILVDKDNVKTQNLATSIYECDSLIYSFNLDSLECKVFHRNS